MKIKVYTNLGKKGELVTSATTFGEIKNQLADQLGVDVTGMKCIIGETSLELIANESVLPITDFQLFVIPSSTKSGYVDNLSERISNILDDVNLLRERLEYLIMDIDEDDEDDEESYTPRNFEDENAMSKLRSLMK